MAKKKIFSDRSRGEAFVGGRRRTLSFDEVEGQTRHRRPPELKTGENASPARPQTRHRRPPELKTGENTSTARPQTRRAPEPRRARESRRSRGRRITGVHVAAGCVCAGALAFLVYFLFFMLPSPIGGLNPSDGSFVKTGNVEVKASFSRAVKPSAVTVAFNGEDATPRARVTARSLTCKVPLEEGRHKVSLEVDGGGLMGKRTAEWGFVVDTTPPKLSISDRKVAAVKGTSDVKVSFKGTTEKGAVVKVGEDTLPVDDKGNFEGAATSSRDRSLKISATDAAGNEAADFVVTQKRTVAKGAHVSVYIASSDSAMAKMMGLVERTELNCLQIDLKDEAGQIGALLDSETARQVNSLYDYIKLDSIVDQMRYNDIYSICRIVVFKDPKLGLGRQDLAIKSKAGGLWGKGQWLDPYSREVWDYNIDVAVAAARAGFNEIQFDYVRFPSDGNTDDCIYPHQDDRKPGEVINGFLEYAREKLAPYNVFISADLFGLTASKQGDMGIGQDVKSVAQRLDYISPMVYPSHYNPGEYNIKSPESNPGDIVTESLKEFKKVMAGTACELRPWLQDFSLRVTYTPDMVRRQIDACESLGVEQWLLWDPDCTYSEDALKEAGSK